MPNPYVNLGYPGTWQPNQPGYLNWAPMNNMPTTYNGYNGNSGIQQQFQQPQQMQQPLNNILKFSGPEGAKAFNMPANSEIIGFDANEPVFYMVTTDDAGFKTLRTFEFAEKVEGEHVAQPFQADLSGFATKDDLDKLRDELTSISKTLKELM